MKQHFFDLDKFFYVCNRITYPLTNARLTNHSVYTNAFPIYNIFPDSTVYLKNIYPV